MTHQFDIRVYYEDTDLAGIVYYANYLKFIERARSTWVHEVGIDQLQMQQKGFYFAVKKVEADYLNSAKLNDELRIETQIHTLTGAQILFSQDVYRAAQKLFSALITVVCITDTGKLTRFPADIRAKLDKIAH